VDNKPWTGLLPDNDPAALVGAFPRAGPAQPKLP
jgi:hypothetical protein